MDDDIDIDIDELLATEDTSASNDSTLPEHLEESEQTGEHQVLSEDLLAPEAIFPRESYPDE